MTKTEEKEPLSPRVAKIMAETCANMRKVVRSNPSPASATMDLPKAERETRKREAHARDERELAYWTEQEARYKEAARVARKSK